MGRLIGAHRPEADRRPRSAWPGILLAAGLAWLVAVNLVYYGLLAVCYLGGPAGP